MGPDPTAILNLENWSLMRRCNGQEVPILQEIDLQIRSGRWLAVLGANGSGKSSLLKFLASDESPLQERRSIMFQDPDDQIIAATCARELGLGRPGLDTATILEEFDLGGLDDLDPRLLSAGQKQRLVLAVSQSAQPEVLFADEPTALQDPRQAQWVLNRLEEWISEPGRTLVTATVDRREVERADEILVLQEGRIVLHGPRQTIIDHPLVSELLGPAVAQRAADENSPEMPLANDPILELKNLVCRFGDGPSGIRLEHLALGQATRLGITGSNGCGKSTLLAALAGARRPEEGQISLLGRALYDTRGALDLDHGLAMLAPQFPEYLFTRDTVAKEVNLDPALSGLEVGKFLGTVGLDASLTERDPHQLSSGQRRRLALGLVLLSQRPLLLLDEPTAALDLAGRRTVLEMLENLPPEATLVIASHDTRFLQEAGCTLLDLDDHKFQA